MASLRYITAAVAVLALSGIISCSRVSPTVIPDPLEEIVTAGDLGSLFPQIQNVSPGTIQSLDIPFAAETGISATNPGISVIFSRVMENDGDEMYFSFELIEDPGGADTSIPYAITPATVSSTVFTLTPLAALTESETYAIRIHDTATENDYPSHTLKFDNLIDMYGAGAFVPASPTYVEYHFATGTSVPADIINPTVNTVVPANGAVNITPDISPNGYIDFTLTDNVAIDPSTVNGSTISLYNTTDSLPVSGTLVVVSATNYQVYPSIALSYDKTYRLRISVGDGITDTSGNSMTQTDYTFSTVAAVSSGNPVVDNYEVTAVTDTSVTVTWNTSSASITHLELDDAIAFLAADVTVHDTTLATTFTEIVAGLTPNTLYSMQFAADNETPGAGGPFDNTTTVNAVFRTLPDTTEGATGDYVAAVRNSTKSDLLSLQLSLFESYLIWNDDGSAIYAQYIDSSSGAEETWNKWGADAGVELLNRVGETLLIDNSEGEVVAAVTDAGGDIYGDSVYDNSGSLARRWGTDSTGKQVYDGTASGVSAAVSFSGYVVEVDSGTAEVDFIYDGATDFSGLGGLDVGDYLINEDDVTGSQTVVSYDAGDPSLLLISGDLISVGQLQYRIGDADVTESAIEQVASSGTTLFVDDGTLDQNDLITDGTDFTYLALGGTWNGTEFEYTTGAVVTFNATAALTTYDYLVNGTTDTNTLYESTADFSSSGVTANDIVINIVSGESDKAASVNGTGNNLLLLSDGGKFLFDSTDAYQVLRLADDTLFVTSGINASTAGSTITATARNFNADGVQAGDIIYTVTGTERYAEITAVSGTDLTLSSQIISGTAAFIIFRQKAVTFVWSEGSNVYGAASALSDGTRLYPSAVTDYLQIADHATYTLSNTHSVADLNGNLLVFYESDETGINIRAKKVRGMHLADTGAPYEAHFLWGGTAATLAGEGISIAGTVNDDLIQKVVADGQGGAFVLYTSHAAGTKQIGVAHVNGSGTASAWSIASAENPDMTLVAAGVVAVVYESNTAAGPRVYLQRYNSSGTLGAALTVESAAGSSGQISPRVVSDGNGGALVSWIDMTYFPTVYYSIYGQHFNSTFATRIYGDDQFVGIPVKDSQGDNPYLIEHGILRYDDAVDPDAGLFFWFDERSATAGEIDIYFRTVAD